MKRIRLTLAVGVLAAAIPFLVGAPRVSAAYNNHAEFQITFSQNCDNAALCLGGAGGLGGDWGWAVLNSDGSGDLQITFCFHAPGLGGGAGHEDVNIYAWSIDTTNHVFFINSASDPTFEGDTPIPAAPGHYNLHPATGVSIEITVVAVPNG